MSLVDENMSIIDALKEMEAKLSLLATAAKFQLYVIAPTEEK